jgi:cupredoxin-like protein
MNLFLILVYNETMSGTIKITLAVIAALLIFAGISIVGLNSQRNTTNGSTSAASDQNAIKENDVEVTITYTGKGFEPNNSVVRVNNYIRVRNRSVRLLKFMSDPYNRNDDEPELNQKELKPGDSVKIYITQKGTWGYHNALDPSETGQLIVR